MTARALPKVPSGKLVKERSIVLAGQKLVYTLRHSARRTLGMTVDQHGLRLAAPKGLSQAQVEAFLQRHADWVLKKLAQQQAASPRAPLVIQHGTRLPLLGRDCPVHIEVGANRVRVECDDHSQRLVLAARPGADDAMLSVLASRALQRHALPLFAERLAIYAARLGKPVPPLALSNARTRWGSCSSRSGIRLNWRLIHLPLSLIDYVVAHELAHLVEMNHSPRFWAVVESLYPQHALARRELKLLGPAIPLLA